MTTKKIQLTTTNVFLGKNKKGQHTRSGFVDPDNQVFLPPANGKRLEFWKKKMSQKGYEFR